MPKYTLLDMTQRVLEAMKGDEVDSIFDTVESETVAGIVEQSYWNFVTNIEVPEHDTLLTLTAAADAASPTQFILPTGVDKVREIRYNVIKAGETDVNYVLIPYCTPEKFLDNTYMLKSSEATSQGIVVGGTTIYIRNDRAPQYWTVFDDENLYFDSFDSAIDSTLQSSKLVCMGVQEPTWTKADSFIPDLDSNLFPALLADATSMAFLELKQQAHAKAEKRARVGKQRWMKHRDRLIDAKDTFRPDYGRN